MRFLLAVTLLGAAYGNPATEINFNFGGLLEGLTAGPGPLPDPQVFDADVPYSDADVNGTDLIGRIFWTEDILTQSEVDILIIAPWFMGFHGGNAASHERDVAIKYAKRGFVTFIMDYYGWEFPATAQGYVDGFDYVFGTLGLNGPTPDLPLIRTRAYAAYATVQAAVGMKSLGAKSISIMGFCLGGTVAYELARAGAQLGGVISYHGNVANFTNGEATNVQFYAAFFGRDDPTIPEAARIQGEQWAAAANPNSFFATLPGMHAFTQYPLDPVLLGIIPNTAGYHPTSAAAAFAMTNSIFADFGIGSWTGRFEADPSRPMA